EADPAHRRRHLERGDDLERIGVDPHDRATRDPQGALRVLHASPMPDLPVDGSKRELPGLRIEPGYAGFARPHAPYMIDGDPIGRDGVAERLDREVLETHVVQRREPEPRRPEVAVCID